jgi:hypothetical protein
MDPAELARMRESLAEHRSAGEYVLQSARMVGDEDDQAIWRRSRCAWRDAVTSMLSRTFPEAERSALDVRLTGAPSGWKKLYEAELRTVVDGLALLDELDRSVCEREDIERRTDLAAPEPTAGTQTAVRATQYTAPVGALVLPARRELTAV